MVSNQQEKHATNKLL